MCQSYLSAFIATYITYMPTVDSTFDSTGVRSFISTLYAAVKSTFLKALFATYTPAVDSTCVRSFLSTLRATVFKAF